jgi:hypothetical protein
MRIRARIILSGILIVGLAVMVQRGFSEESFQEARQNMVARQLQRRDITDPRVLIAMGKVPRHRFVPEALASHAYEDRFGADYLSALYRGPDDAVGRSASGR